MNERIGLTRYRREFIICPLELVWALTGTAFTSSSVSTPHSFLLGFIEPVRADSGSSLGDDTRRDLASPAWFCSIILFGHPVTSGSSRGNCFGLFSSST